MRMDLNAKMRKMRNEIMRKAKQGLRRKMRTFKGHLRLRYMSKCDY